MGQIIETNVNHNLFVTDPEIIEANGGKDDFIKDLVKKAEEFLAALPERSRIFLKASIYAGYPVPKQSPEQGNDNPKTEQ